ncbi:hypothetical protein [Chamaesiphon sp. OTE_75_metabat_556]|nr:hypothetical protein [Chamaesiphon sp. OTE_75_metabat_556]
MTDYPETIANNAINLVQLFDRHHIDIHVYTFDRSTKLNHVCKIAP